jgi:hypothetical protein
MFKDGILCWEFCPNCDAKLTEPCGIGDDWECAECGESGTREHGRYDTTFVDWLNRIVWPASTVEDDGIMAAGAAADAECPF